MRLEGVFKPRMALIITDKAVGGCGGEASVLLVESVVEIRFPEGSDGGSLRVGVKGRSARKMD